MNELVESSTELSTDVNDLSQWGLEEQHIDSKDVVLPRLWLCQALSKAVAEDEVAAAGDIINSVTQEVLATAGNSLKVVPIRFEKLWFVMDHSGDKPEYLASEPVTPHNANRSREGVWEGKPCVFNYALRFYVLVEGEALPAVVTFKSTGLRAGKQLVTEAYVKNLKAGKNPASRYMELSATKEKNDKGVYYAFAIKPAGETSAELQGEALQWVKTLQQTEAKIAGDEHEPEAESNETEQY